MQIKIVFANGVQRLKQVGIPEPELETSLLLSHVLKMERTEVLLKEEKVLDKKQLEDFEKKISRRLNREPLAYIIGEKEFWSLPFKVTKDVLIPRPETEFLLEKALAVLKGMEGDSKKKVKILDLGTGSGVIGIVLALELLTAKVTAIDYSLNALKVANHNAKKHKVEERIDFINCDWFGGIMAKADFDVVISNPPYVAREVLAKPPGRNTSNLQPEVVDFEPQLALDGGERGIQEIRIIAVELEKMLKPGGWFFMEIGADQEKEVSSIFNRNAVYSSCEILYDYAGLPRVLRARKKQNKSAITKN
ncbi:MAG: peptide chain release factor N(5)-glutamine methyltransferase [Deltaproteobacteria bacterium]|nr:MAG: peptide chain release factor N(5)-glutamine methyltransferase [Deltaproteobacteria bacterium]